MGTRSTVKFIEKLKDSEGKEEEVVLVSIYQQYDGYPSGVGMTLAEFLQPIEMVNGISSYDKPIANGMGCLSAQYIAHIKDGVGTVYITNPDDKQGYDYEVVVGWEGEGFSSKPTQPVIRIKGLYIDEPEEDEADKMDFEGTPQEFIDLVKSGKVG